MKVSVFWTIVRLIPQPLMPLPLIPLPLIPLPLISLPLISLPLDIVASDIVASDIVASNRTVTNNAGLDMTSSNIAGILSWNTVVTADWNPDNSQSVYKGE